MFLGLRSNYICTNVTVLDTDNSSVFFSFCNSSASLVDDAISSPSLSSSRCANLSAILNGRQHMTNTTPMSHMQEELSGYLPEDLLRTIEDLFADHGILHILFDTLI